MREKRLDQASKLGGLGNKGSKESAAGHESSEQRNANSDSDDKNLDGIERYRGEQDSGEHDDVLGETVESVVIGHESSDELLIGDDDEADDSEVTAPPMLPEDAEEHEPPAEAAEKTSDASGESSRYFDPGAESAIRVGERVARVSSSAPQGSVSESGNADWRMHFDLALDALDWPSELSRAAQLEHLNRALDSVNRAILDAPEEEVAVCYSTRGFIHLSLGDFARAEDDCSAAVERDASDIEALVWRGCARAGQGTWVAAIQDLTDAIGHAGERAGEFIHTRDGIVQEALEDIRQQVVAGNATAETFLDRGYIYELLGEFERALRDFNQAWEACPESIEARLGVARAQLALGDLVAAREQVDRILGEPNAERRAPLMLRARIYQAAGEMQRAVDDLVAVKASDPDSLALRLECGEIGLELGDIAGAIEDLTYVLKKDRKNLKPRRARALAYLKARNYELAIRDIDFLMHKEGDSATWLAHRGLAHSRKADFEHARRDYERAIELDELSAQAYLGMGQVLEMQGERGKAAKYCARALRLDSRLAEAYLLRGKLFFDQQKTAESIEEFTRVIRLKPADEISADAFYRRGIAYVQSGRSQHALDDFHEAILRRMHHAGTFVWRSSTYAARGEWVQAVNDLRRAIELSPDNAAAYRRLGKDISRRAVEHAGKQLFSNDADANALYQRGLARHFLGDPEAAVSDFAQARKLAPENLPLLLAYIDLLVENGEYEVGIHELTVFLSRNPAELLKHDRAVALQHRARLRRLSGDLSVALDDIREAIKLMPRQADVRIELGELFMANQRWDKAIGELSRAARFDPTSFRAFALRGRCNLMIGSHMPAIYDFSRSLEIFPEQAETLAARGHAYLKNHQHVQALADFENALAKSADLLEAYTGRAIVLAKRGESENALIWLTKAFHRFDQPAQWAILLVSRGRIFFNMCRFPRAIGDYTATLGWQVDAATEAVAAYSRGVAYLHEGETEAARKDFELTLRVQPSYRPARVALDWIDGKIRERPKALVVPRHVVRPTRPRVIRRPVTELLVDESWEIKPPFDQWIVRSKEGVEFGPTPKVLLDQWCREGRIDDETRLLRADWEKWRRASVVYPELLRNANQATTGKKVEDSETFVTMDGDLIEQPSSEEHEGSASVSKSTRRTEEVARSSSEKASNSDREPLISENESKNGGDAKTGDADYQHFEALDGFLESFRDDGFSGVKSEPSDPKS